MNTPNPDDTSDRPKTAVGRTTRVRLLVTGLAALLVGVGGTLAVDRTLLGANASDNLTDRQICDGAVVSGDVGSVTRNLPSASAVTSTWVDSARDSTLRERCTISAGGAMALRLTATLDQGSIGDWERRLKSEGFDADGPKMVFNVGDRAVSHDQDAAVHVSCTLPRNQPKDDHGKTVTTYISVLAHGAGPAVENNDRRRQDLAYLASRVAEHAHFTMGCKEPLNLPDGEPKLTAAK